MLRFYSYSVCLCLLLLGFSWKASAQAAVVIGEPKVSDKYSRESAEKALREGTANLLIVGGIAPVIYRGQEKFKKKYGVGYYDFGDLVECSHQEMRAFNEVIFEWLTQLYGKKWQEDVRPDVAGLDKWLLYRLRKVLHIVCFRNNRLVFVMFLSQRCYKQIVLSPILKIIGFFPLHEYHFHDMLSLRAPFFVNWLIARLGHSGHESGQDGIRVSWLSMLTDWRGNR